MVKNGIYIIVEAGHVFVLDADWEGAVRRYEAHKAALEKNLSFVRGDEYVREPSSNDDHGLAICYRKLDYSTAARRDATLRLERHVPIQVSEEPHDTLH